jgi:hypothetical protein
LLKSDQRNLWRVKLLNNPNLAQNVLKRLNIENEIESKALNSWQPKLLNNDKRYWLEFTRGRVCVCVARKPANNSW